MINHNFNEINIDENYPGEQIFPYEKGNLAQKSILRNFIVSAYQSYSSQSLSAFSKITGAVVQNHIDNSFVSDTNDTPYFIVKLTVKPSDIRQFILTGDADNFFTKLVEIIGRSEVRNFRGNRSAFIGQFNKQDVENIGECLVSYIFISRSTFYNDYRVTTCYPLTEFEYDLVIEDIFKRITLNFPHLPIEIGRHVRES